MRTHLVRGRRRIIGPDGHVYFIELREEGVFVKQAFKRGGFRRVPFETIIQASALQPDLPRIP